MATPVGAGSAPTRWPGICPAGTITKRPGGVWTLGGIAAFLRGGLPGDDDRVKSEDLYGFADRTGLEIDADTLTGVDGRLFATRLLSLKPGVGFYAEALLPRHAAEDL